MIIETLEIAGHKSALHGMRNPLDSWNKSDSTFYSTADGMSTIDFHVGENDATLSCKLQDAGPEHCKHLRMIQVWADISAPRFW